MNLNNTTNKSPQELKNQVLNDVKKVREDLDEIKNRLTPGQIIDDAIYYRSGSNNPAQTFEHLKNNPIGTSFLTLGTLLLMENSEHRTFEGIARERAGGVKSKVSNAVSNAKVESLDDIEDLKSGAKRNLESVIEKAREGLESTKAKVQDAYQSASSTVRDLDPLTYLVLGAGLGAITGVALPLSDIEENFVNERMQPKMVQFRLDLESALNESANILKNEFIGGISNLKINLF